MAEAKILVIDDEQVMCELLTDLLQDKGHNVRYSLSGKEGVNLARENNFDIIMCDLKMPDMDGISVLREIREFNQDSVLVVITGFPSFETIQAALRVGAYDYLAKPFNIEDISFIINRAIVLRNLTITNRKLVKTLEEQNIKLEEKVKERTKELSLIYSIGRDISSSLKLDEVLRTIVDRVSRVLNIEISSILLWDKKIDSFVIRFASGISNEIISQTEVKMGEPISGWVAQNKEAVLVEDIEHDSRFARKNQEKYYTHSFISVPLIVKENVIGVFNVNNKKSREPFTKDDFRFVKGVATEAAIAVDNASLYTALEETYLHVVLALTSALDAKDHYIKKHSEHVALYAEAISIEMGCSSCEIENIRHACELHDVGKIGIHDQILTKPGALTSEEWEEMKLHSLKSVEILKPLSFLDSAISLIEQHHERYDGRGYPYGIGGEDIKLGARIMNAADSFDAMVTDRPYRKAIPLNEAIEELKRGSGKQFDPKVVEVFLKILEREPGIVKK